MQKKDIAFIKIIQLIGKKKNVKMGEEGGIYDSFNIKADEKGNYKKDPNNPFSQRSLLRYVEELCEIGIIKCEGEGQNKYYSINEDKYVYDLKEEKNSISNLLKILIEKKEMKLFEKLIKIVSNDNNAYGEKEIDKLLKKIKTPYEDYEVNQEIECNIKIAICESRNIEVKYRQKKYNITPIAIVKSGNATRKYLFYLRKNKMGQPFEMSNIREGTLLDIHNFDKKKYIHNISNRWDIDGGATFNVKVFFFDNKEVIKKVKQDINNRRSKYEFDKVENGYIYKDTIEGISDFKAWLRNYSDISVVLEPKALCEEIIHRNVNKLNRYGVSENEI